MFEAPLNSFEKCALSCLLGPPFYLVLFLIGRTHKQRKQKRNSSYDPFGMKSFVPETRREPALNRPRRLTLPSDDLVLQSMAIETQSGSALLQKLPREIRNIIWKEAVGGRVIHLWYKSGFGHLLCTYQKEECAEEWKRINPCLSCWRGKVSSGKEMLGLILTCRTIYSEAINYLYSENTFDPVSPQLISSLPRLLLPQRLNRITSLRFCWRDRRINKQVFPENYALLKDLLKTLAEMDGLRVLRMNLWADLAKEVQENDELSAQIANINRPRVFEVMLEPIWRSDVSVFEDLPCTIVMLDGSV